MSEEQKVQAEEKPKRTRKAAPKVSKPKAQAKKAQPEKPKRELIIHHHVQKEVQKD